MRYFEFKDQVETELKMYPDGFSWKELQDRLDLPYKTACPEWIKRLEQEIGLRRVKGQGRALIWKLG